MVLKELVLQNGLESGCLVPIVWNLERYFPYWWQLTGVNECILLEIHVFLGWFLKILWSQVTNNWAVSEIHDFHGVGMLGICTFCRFLDEFSAWSHKLKWRYRILVPSVTGKVQNSWTIYMKFCKIGQFQDASQTHWTSKLVLCKGRSESTLAVF